MKNSKNSRNITKSFIKKSTPNSHEVKDAKYYEDAKGNKYYVDGKNVVIDYSVSEKNVANWLKETFGGEIYMLPRINIPEGIQTADYLFRGEKWDLKEIKSTGKNVLDNRVNGLKKQANNFIFDISNASISIKEIKNQINKLYESPNRKWINKIMLIKNQKLICIYIRKKDWPSAKKGQWPISNVFTNTFYYIIYKMSTKLCI